MYQRYGLCSGKRHGLRKRQSQRLKQKTQKVKYMETVSQLPGFIFMCPMTHYISNTSALMFHYVSSMARP